MCFNILNQLENIFGSYGFVNEILRPSNFTFITFFTNGVGVVHHALLTMLVAYSGTVVSKAAKRTPKIISDLMNGSSVSESQKIDFIFFMTQIRSRNLNIENDLFTINWRLTLGVSFANTFHSSLS